MESWARSCSCTPNLAQVLLISDQSSGVGAILEKSRLQGVLRGTANGEVVLERVMSDEQVQPGETVLTSGGDQIFPKGLPVGTVTKVGNGKDLFLNIKIKPAANLSRLEEVLVLTEKQEREAVADEHVRVRAADILAQRLPSVPDKPATDTTPAGVAQGASPAPAGANAAAKPAGTTAGNAAERGEERVWKCASEICCGAGPAGQDSLPRPRLRHQLPRSRSREQGLDRSQAGRRAGPTPDPALDRRAKAGAGGSST